MDELYLDNIDEFVNDHNKIVSVRLSRVMSSFLNGTLDELMSSYQLARMLLAVEPRSENCQFTLF